jgi:predicted AAA+ superfamily ATPase
LPSPGQREKRLNFDKEKFADLLFNRKFARKMIGRNITGKLLSMGNKFPVVTLTGPRQSGKSTLLKSILPDYNYVSMEDPDNRLLAHEDPRGFIKSYPDKTIIDEVQRVPELFSYLQTHVDAENREGMYYLVGSQNFLLLQSISQSLAGRTAILKLLPFSHSELKKAEILPTSVNNEIFQGGYPRIYDKKIQPTDFYPSYIQTFIEKDLRLLKNIDDLSKFIRFIKLCAGRIGQLLNLSSLANDTGIAVSTVQSWLSVLEASYIIYLLKPDHNNYSKRLIKSPKLYFWDTGLASSLLGIEDEKQLSTHFLRGGLFENMVINEFVKNALNNGKEPNLTFWRDSTGNEVDFLFSKKGKQLAYEIKSGATYSSDYFKGIKVWANLSKTSSEDCYVIYSGDKRLSTSHGEVIPWNEL